MLCIGYPQDLVERSIVVRDEKKKRGWKEMYDPVTFGFWYYNEFSLRNSWEAPLVFQKTFGESLLCCCINLLVIK
jgi:hypothetical protein